MKPTATSSIPGRRPRPIGRHGGIHQLSPKMSQAFRSCARLPAIDTGGARRTSPEMVRVRSALQGNGVRDHRRGLVSFEARRADRRGTPIRSARPCIVTAGAGLDPALGRRDQGNHPGDVVWVPRASSTGTAPPPRPQCAIWRFRGGSKRRVGRLVGEGRRRPIPK